MSSGIQVTGTVRARDEKNINRDMATGEIEVLASSLTIINRAAQMFCRLTLTTSTPKKRV